MREILLDFIKRGEVMTCEDLARVLKITPDTVRRKAKAGIWPRIPHLWEVRFDPEAMMNILCDSQKAEKPRSLTIERHKRQSVKPLNGGYVQCL
mgnify:CR=1 FL=1